MKTQSHKLSRLFLLGTSLALVLTTQALMAGKPASGGGGGTTPAGTIYYTWMSASSFTQPAVDRGDWTMKADGTGKTLRPYQGQTHSGARLSHQLHYGQRWILELATNPATGNFSIYAVNEAGTGSVLLADGAPQGVGVCRTAHWAKDDSFISVATATSTFAQLYRASVGFDASGIPFLTSTWQWVVSGEQAGYFDIDHHDWSPDGSQVVLGITPQSGQASVKIRDLTTQTTRLLADNSYHPRWSPDGQWIAFTPFNSALCIIHPDGSGFTSIGTKSGGVDIARDWSPDSQHILFARYLYKSVKGGYGENTYDVMRMPTTGGNPSNLTSDIDGQAIPLWWR
jgi:hypothetical protein